MKRNRMYAGSALLCALALMTSCSNEETMENTARSFTLKANMGVTQTRTTVATETTGSKYPVNWSGSDQIYVYGTNVEGTLTLESGDGATTGTFKGILQGESSSEALQYALYPKPTVNSEGGKTITLPSQYTYGDNSNSPMYGVFGEDKTTVDFLHLCGMIRLKIGGIPSDGNEKTLTLTSNDGAITGEATVAEANGALSLGTPTGDGKTVTFTIPANTSTTSALVFDIPLPVGTYSNGLKLNLTSGDKEIVQAKTLSNVVIEAGKILVMRTLHIHSVTGTTTPIFEETLPVATSEALRNALADEKVKVIELTENITLSSDLSITSQEGKTIDLGNNEMALSGSRFVVKEGATLKLTNGHINPDTRISNVYKGATLMLEGITTPENNKSMVYGIYANAGEDQEGTGENATVILKDCKIYAAGLPLSTNANVATEGYKPLTITIENSTLCGMAGLMINVPSKVKVTNSHLLGGLQGLMVRGGTVECIDTEITKNKFSYPTVDNDFKTWGSGNQVTPAAITLGNKDSNSYQYPTSLTLTRCTVSVKNSEDGTEDNSPVVYAHANSDKGKGVTFNYDDATKSMFSPAVDIKGRFIYASSNITVNGTETKSSEASN